MSWDKVRMGFYCDRCKVLIDLQVRNQRFMPYPHPGRMAGDPYVSVSYVAFSEEEKARRQYQGSFQYCWDCEKEFNKIIEEFNKNKPHPDSGTNQGSGAGHDSK